jgi:rubrerythrin
MAALPTKKFKRTVENFVCEKCGTSVVGTGYTDHCPKCLTSKHVDNNPGDRSSDCRGLMDAISTDYQGREFKINYRCEKCGVEKRVRAAHDDNVDLLSSQKDHKRKR